MARGVRGEDQEHGNIRNGRGSGKGGVYGWEQDRRAGGGSHDHTSNLPRSIGNGNGCGNAGSGDGLGNRRHSDNG